MRSLTTSFEIDRGDDVFEIDIEYEDNPFVAATYSQPAEGGDIEIISVTHNGKPFELTYAEESRVTDYCARHCTEYRQGQAEEAAEYRAQERREAARGGVRL